jgi:hypothetical protein
MAINTDVKSVTVTEDGTAYGARARVRAVAFVTNGSAGSVVLKDGGSGGTTKIDLATPATTDFYHSLVPEDGVLFETDVYADLTNITSLTVFYG